jgi:hypothetical protein
MNMNFGLEKCARICLNRGRFQSRIHTESTFGNDIKELDPRKACKYLGIEESYNIQHMNETEKLKKVWEYPTSLPAAPFRAQLNTHTK